MPNGSKRGRIMVVDDDLLIGTMVRDLLGNEHCVTVETDPFQAIARVREGERYDLILCDLHMPGCSGQEVLEALRWLEPDVCRRFVYITGGGVSSRDGLALGDAPAEILAKPFDLAALRRVVAAHLDRGVGPRAATRARRPSVDGSG